MIRVKDSQNKECFMFANDFPVSVKDFSSTFKLAERTPYMMIKGEPEIYETIKRGKNTFIPSSAVRFYRNKKNLKRLGDKIYSFYMRKGGVGKTSLLMNLSAKAVMSGYKVLLIDMDSQANLTKAYKIRDVKMKDTFQDVFDGISTLNEARIKVKNNLYLIPCNNKFAGLANKINPMEVEIKPMAQDNYSNNPLIHCDRKLSQSDSAWVRSFSCEELKPLIVCRGVWGAFSAFLKL